MWKDIVIYLNAACVVSSSANSDVSGIEKYIVIRSLCLFLVWLCLVCSSNVMSAVSFDSLMKISVTMDAVCTESFVSFTGVYSRRFVMLMLCQWWVTGMPTWVFPIRHL